MIFNKLTASVVELREIHKSLKYYYNIIIIITILLIKYYCYIKYEKYMICFDFISIRHSFSFTLTHKFKNTIEVVIFYKSSY